MNHFLRDFYHDADRAAYISGYRTFIAMEEFLTDPGHGDISGVTQKGFFINPSKVFIEAFMNGTIAGMPVGIMENASFKNYQARVNNITEKIDIIFNATVTHASMEHQNSWSVDVTLHFSVRLRDKRGLASWNTTKTLVTTIPIVDLKDPLYTVNTGLPVTVRTYPYDEFINDTGDQNHTYWLKEFLDETYFISSNRSPSFVMRFSNNLSPSEFGIESMVNILDLKQKGLSIVENASIVDFLYFNESDGTAHNCSFEGHPALPAWLKLDNESLEYPYDELGTEIESGMCP